MSSPPVRSALPGSYVLPIAAALPQLRALSGYLRRLAGTMAEVIVVDGSPPAVFAAHGAAWGQWVRHLPPAVQTRNGKVAGVLTGVAAARHERVIIADDDVRYRRAELERMLAALDRDSVVRPQNHFVPRPWHARWDTARSLFNRLSGGDWPGTLGVRCSALLAAGGYAGDVLFENLEMVRTVQAAGGTAALAPDLFVARRPPSAAHFRSQRLRQAYDEWARPRRLAAQLALLPAGVLLLRRFGLAGIVGAGVVAIGAAELGRRRDRGRTVFPPDSALWAPAWVAERAVTSWLALGTRLLLGGVRYRDGRLGRAATPPALLAERLRQRGIAQDHGGAQNASMR